ncbi:hypothetical protein EMCRGX_G006067 [Ephydatia muelleri]
MGRSVLAALEVRNLTARKLDHDPHLLLWQHIQHARGHIRCLSAPEQVQHMQEMARGRCGMPSKKFLAKNLGQGLSNIASPSATTTGGICSTSFFSSSSGTRIIYNTALSSYTSSSNPLVFVEEVLVTGHEIDHSWGSYHDPATTPSCSNVFIMNQYAQDGSQPTHKMFSNCSRTSIGAVLSAKAQNCFTVRGTGTPAVLMPVSYAQRPCADLYLYSYTGFPPSTFIFAIRMVGATRVL